MKNKNYIPYSTKIRQCEKDGTQKPIKCLRCGQIILLCTKYLNNCNSGLCRKERGLDK